MGAHRCLVRLGMLLAIASACDVRIEVGDGDGGTDGSALAPGSQDAAGAMADTGSGADTGASVPDAQSATGRDAAGVDAGAAEYDASAPSNPDASSATDAGPSACPGLAPIIDTPGQLYVAPDGSDSASGAIGSPLKTLAKAAQLLPNGGTVIVRGGTYPAQSGISAVGTATHPLVVRPAAGESPIFDATGVTSASAVIVFSSAQHVIVDGLEIRNCSAPGCGGIRALTQVLDVTVRNCHIHDTMNSAVHFGGKTIRVEGNHIHDVVLVNLNGALASKKAWPSCSGNDVNTTASPYTDDVVFRLNHIHDCWGEGISIFIASNIVIEDNVVENTWNVGIYVDDSFTFHVERNFVSMAGSGHGAGSGIALGTETSGLHPTPVHDGVIANNVVASYGNGINWWTMTTPSESYYFDLSIFHNTVVTTNQRAITFAKVPAGQTAPSGCVVENNVFSTTTSASVPDPGAFTFAGNAWLNQARPSFAGSTDVLLNVKVPTINAGTDAEPLAAQVGAGVAGTGIATDFLCAPRSASAPTRGAFEQ